MHGRLAVLAGLVLSLLGCSDPPRTIETAKPVAPPSSSSQLTELPKVEKPAKSDPQAEALLTKAIAAHTSNNPERLQKLKNCKITREGNGIIFTAQKMPMKWELYHAWPGRMRYRIEIISSLAQIVTLGNNHRDAWMSSGATLPPTKMPMPAPSDEDFRLDATGEWFLTLYPLQHPERIATPLPDTTVNGKPAKSIRIWIPELSDTVLNFDQESGLLVQVLYDGREQNKKTLKEFLVLSHKEFLGVQTPEKLAYKSNGNELADYQVKAVDALADPVEAKLFSEP